METHTRDYGYGFTHGLPMGFRIILLINQLYNCNILFHM